MPKLRMMRYGCSLSFASGLSGRDMGEQQKHNKRRNRGWTKAATRNLTNFLMRMDFPQVEGTPYAFTLTIPARHMDAVGSGLLHRLLADWIRGQHRRHGLAHYYWIIEFTAAGTPHIHMTCWCRESHTVYDRHTRTYRSEPLPAMRTQLLMLLDWVTMCEKAGIPSQLSAQDFRPIDDTPEAWMAYTAKHSARGVAHYQRRLDAMPDDWRMRPGAMWGHDRALSDAQADCWDLHMSKEAFWQFRRVIRKHLEQQARQIKDPQKRGKAIAATRRMLKQGITAEEAHRKRWLNDDERFLPKSAFMGVRAWMSPEEQASVWREIAEGPYSDIYKPLIGQPTRRPTPSEAC